MGVIVGPERLHMPQDHDSFYTVEELTSLLSPVRQQGPHDWVGLYGELHKIFDLTLEGAHIVIFPSWGIERKDCFCCCGAAVPKCSGNVDMRVDVQQGEDLLCIPQQLWPLNTDDHIGIERDIAVDLILYIFQSRPKTAELDTEFPYKANP
ncbi:hypothetical protein COCSADRAFT_164955 [Bipolaris sorokiniana ND90Pr]|uniref:Uncharacterized protein n=1 Tax=Cochliobolus sativus (strain ND90Pr / ATCC 201652) TaxID=665912 RepID=M2SRI0_COCSN|nr:uncharacterized protein COCSADRAFT_164955 [Bipolaris sorokiniana ND90Pr]EMD59407.1 hypothetical protein COCSADRAFT_164955 [Bipolaris sorokiniana ND90Pr]